MRLNKGTFFLTAIMLLCWGVTNAQQSENKNVAAEAAAKRQAELAKIGRITVDELKSKIAHDDSILILDVRMPDDYDKADKKIKGSIRISPYDLKARMNEIPKDKDIVTYCT